METQQAPKRSGTTKYHLPAEPFRQVIRSKIAQATDNAIYERATQVAMRIWGPDCDWNVQTCHNSLRKFLNPGGSDHTGESVHFDTADKILTRLGLSSLWVADPELSELYYSVDLATLDVASPTCEKVKQEIIDTFEELGASKTAQVFNTGPTTVRRAVQRFAVA